MSPTSYQTAPPRVVASTISARIEGPPRPGAGPLPFASVRFRRRRRQGDAETSAGTAVVPAPRVERALVAIAVHAQQLDDRMVRLERRIEDLALAGAKAPTHEDILDVRLHSAKVAGELTRLSIALRAEIEQATRPDAGAPERERLLHFAEQVRQLSDRLEDEGRLSA
jgi:hypothetical protein